MLRNVVVRSDVRRIGEDVLVVPVYKNAPLPDGSVVRLKGLGRSTYARFLGKGTFKGDRWETLLVTTGSDEAPPHHVLLLGLGDRGRITAEDGVEAGGAAAKAVSKLGARSAALALDGVGREADRISFAHAFVKGFSLAQYRYMIPDISAESDSLTKLAVLSKSRKRELTAAAQRALLIAQYTARARDMVNAPANMLTPTALAEAAKRTAREHGLACRVIGPAEMRKRKMGAILGVARGSREEPRFVVLEYNRRRKRLPLVCLVGKGVTFDSGGLSLKPWERMNEMKGDMAGAAVAINVVAAAARLRLALRVVAVVPAVENMPDGAASRPGDVITTYAGKTVEILSTDAEGRLVLADGITFVRKHYRPAVLVDFATLTGAVMIALGTRIAAVMGNEQSFINRMIAAGERAGEPVWQLPLDQRFYDSVKGDITDYKNYSGRNGGAITAAALLGKFAGNDPWVHVDIAGTFWNDGTGASYQAKGGTGFGVDLALRFLEDITSGT